MICCQLKFLLGNIFHKLGTMWSIHSLKNALNHEIFPLVDIAEIGFGNNGTSLHSIFYKLRRAPSYFRGDMNPPIVLLFKGIMEFFSVIRGALSNRKWPIFAALECMMFLTAAGILLK